jgi:hypothetical protein
LEKRNDCGLEDATGNALPVRVTSPKRGNGLVAGYLI